MSSYVSPCDWNNVLDYITDPIYSSDYSSQLENSPLIVEQTLRGVSR